jgi:alpha-ribazole phosphatase
MRVYLVRHPTPLVETGVCYGRTDLLCAADVQADTLAAALPFLPASLVGIPLYSSPLRRCADLAAAMALALPGTAVILDERLMEMDFGVWESRRWDDIPRHEIDVWRDNLLSYRPGGGESLLQLTQRVHAFYRELLATGAENVVIVCHSGSMRAFAACAPGRSVEETALAVKAMVSPAYGEVVAVDIASLQVRLQR